MKLEPAIFGLVQKSLFLGNRGVHPRTSWRWRGVFYASTA